MKFKYKDKGTITQGFSQNLNPLYNKLGLPGHTGVDSTKGYGSLIQFDNTGVIYKVWRPQERADNWCAIHQLVHISGDNYMEVVIGHCKSIFVTEGETVLEGQYAGTEGNYGLVYAGGVQITPAMQDAGDRRGSHRHEAFRPVLRVAKTVSGQHYLNRKVGRYQDKDGYFYQIARKDAWQGYIDPRQYDHEDTKAEKVRALVNALTRLQVSMAKPLVLK